MTTQKQTPSIAKVTVHVQPSITNPESDVFLLDEFGTIICTISNNFRDKESVANFLADKINS